MINFVEGLSSQGDFLRIPIGPFSAYFINDADLVKEVFVTHADKVNKPASIKRAGKALFGENLFTSDGETWRSLRKVVAPAFQRTTLHHYTTIMYEETQRMLDDWEEGGTIDIPQAMMGLTMATATQSIFGENIGNREAGDAIVRFIELFNDRSTTLFPLPVWLPTAKNRDIKHCLKVVKRQLQPMIDERRHSTLQGNDVLSILLRAQESTEGCLLSDHQVYNEISNLFAAGYEVVPHTLTFTLYLLAEHPQITARLKRELDAISLDEIESIIQLSYLEKVLKESMRKLPVATVLARQTTSEIDIGVYRIKKNKMIIISPWTLHRHARYFKQPEQFDPERFDPSNSRIRKYSYIPFGLGPRVCLGNYFAMLQMKINIALILKNFDLSLVPNYRLEPIYRFNTRPKGGLPMIVMRR
jgi:cytochrome P450